MSDLAILKEMIKDTATVPLVKYKNNNYKAILEQKEEKDPTNIKANYTVEIIGLPDSGDVIVVKADTFEAPIKIFNGNNGECKRSDFVIIADVKPKKVIVFIELKAGTGGTRQEMIQQLKGAECFARYCQYIGCSFWNRNDFLNEYDCRFVAIVQICNSIRKKPTSEKDRKVLNNTPETMLKIGHRREIYFRELIQ
ncbi:hypothetical protein [Chamaesiphon sp.]|uniref:hypothetical protein n=1 Tax=Chamaesiphon sp. TaxID=2814140 RepID=UPI0035946EC8